MTTETFYHPKITVIVMTYNSGVYVEETLNSIKNQDYKNIELIITDDGSKDNTIEVCEKWIEHYKEHFNGCQIITVKANSGISANINRALKKCTGLWVKIIAGDDILTTSCIRDNISFVLENDNICAVHSNVDYYSNTFKQENFKLRTDKKGSFFNSKKISAKGQFKALVLCGIFIQAPTIFLKTSMINDIGGLDDRMKLAEDVPLWYRILLKGYKFYFLDSVTVKYRVHDKSISNVKRSGPIQDQKTLERELRQKEYILPNLNLFEKQLAKLIFKIQRRALMQDKPKKYLLFLNKFLQYFSFSYLKLSRVI